MQFFEQTIERIHKPLAVVLDAAGCREGWLQGELFRAGKKLGVCVNQRFAPGQTADLACGDPLEMLAEIKIVGAWHQPKMRAAIESDVARLRAFKPKSVRKYMILIIPAGDDLTALGTYLGACRFSRIGFDRTWPEFRARCWEL